MRWLLGLVAVLAGIGAYTYSAAQDGGDGGDAGGGDPPAISSNDAEPGDAEEPDEDRPPRPAVAPAAPAANGQPANPPAPPAVQPPDEDPFALPPEMLNGFSVNALPDPSRTVEQIKAEAEAAVQKFLAEQANTPASAAGQPAGK